MLMIYLIIGQILLLIGVIFQVPITDIIIGLFSNAKLSRIIKNTYDTIGRDKEKEEQDKYSCAVVNLEVEKLNMSRIGS